MKTMTEEEKDKLQKEYEDLNPLMQSKELTFNQYEEIDKSQER